MGRLGHASMRAALIYQHRTMTRDRAIAEALDALIEQRHMILGRLGTDRDQASLFDYPAGCRDRSLTRANAVERVTRIELAWPAWKVAITAPAGVHRVARVRL